MALDKATTNLLTRFAQAFKDARDRSANESDTVMFIVKMLEEVFGYDSLKGEISKELAIKDRYCDIALKIDGTPRVLVECKAASIKELVEKHIEQAENYASRAGICWVLLTNGIQWKLFHLSFAEVEGITHDLAFDANFIDEMAANPDELWKKLSLLSRESVAAEELDDYWEEKKALSPASVIRVLFSQDVLTAIRRELNRNAPARLDMDDVMSAVRDLLSKEALMEAGEITITKRRRRRRKAAQNADDVATPSIPTGPEPQVIHIPAVQAVPPSFGSTPPA